MLYVSFVHYRFFDRRDFEYVEMDTDTAYMAVTGPLDDIVRPDLRSQYFADYGKWFPRPYCDKHAKDFTNAKDEWGRLESTTMLRRRLQVRHENAWAFQRGIHRRWYRSVELQNLLLLG